MEKEKLPDASAVTVPTGLLPFINLTLAPGKTGGVGGQGGAGLAQAKTVPLTVKPVTVSDTLIVCGLTEIAVPVLSAALIVIFPLYLPGAIPAELTFTPKLLPVPLSAPDGGERTSHELLAPPAVAVHETGRAHVPVSLKGTFCAVEDPPRGTVNIRLSGNCASIQDDCKVSLTMKVSGLPCTVPPEASLAEMVTFVVYVFGCRPARLTATPILPD